jgi:hypothetical protein
MKRCAGRRVGENIVRRLRAQTVAALAGRNAWPLPVRSREARRHERCTNGARSSHDRRVAIATATAHLRADVARILLG